MPKWRVLLVYGRHSALTQARETLDSARYDVSLASSLKEGRRLAAAGGFDVILLGMAPPWSDLLRFYREVRDNPATKGIPLVLVDSRTDGEVPPSARPAPLGGLIEQALPGAPPKDFRQVLAEMELSLRQIGFIEQMLETRPRRGNVFTGDKEKWS